MWMGTRVKSKRAVLMRVMLALTTICTCIIAKITIKMATNYCLQKMLRTKIGVAFVDLLILKAALHKHKNKNDVLISDAVQIKFYSATYNEIHAIVGNLLKRVKKPAADDKE
jgi:hypothetical protein